ncbi:MAG: winged helix-turn-helix domain-containing protein [Ktedonobacterales bacterium]
MTSTQLSRATSAASADQEFSSGIDLPALVAAGCGASASQLAALAEKLRLALPRPERLDAAVGSILPQLSMESAGLRELAETIQDLDGLQRKPLHFEPIELGDLLMGILPQWKERAPAHSLELALPGELPSILASPRHAERATNILIEAAVSLAPAHSSVRVSIRPQLDDVLVSVQCAGAEPGRPDLDHLFEPFYRPPAMPDFRVGGGLGLTLARAILHAHGGRLWAEQPSGSVTIALLATWPLVPASPVELPAYAPAPDGDSTPGRLTLAGERPVILVLDTDSRMLRYLRANLEAQRFKPVLARNLEEMFRLIDLEEPDLLLLDIGSIGRAEAVADDIIRELQALVPAPIICLSEQNDPLECARLLDLGATDYLGKLFGLEELLARIRAALRAHRAHSRSGPRSSRFQSGELSIEFSERQVMIGERQIALSKTEFKLLRVLAEHAGMVLPHEALLSRVWGLGYSQEVEFVWVYIRRLRKKIEPDPSMPTYIQTVPGVGYRLVRR